MKRLFLTLIVALATVCGFAQEKVWEDVVTGYRTSTVFDVNADPRDLGQHLYCYLKKIKYLKV